MMLTVETYACYIVCMIAFYHNDYWTAWLFCGLGWLAFFIDVLWTFKKNKGGQNGKF